MEKCHHIHGGLHDAVRSGCLEAVCLMLGNGADVNAKDGSGNTPLLLAVCIRQEEIYNAIVKRLIESGADVNAYNKGLTPLYNAVFYKRQESVRMLLQEGAWLAPTFRNELHLLAELGGSNILEIILSDKRCTPDTVNLPDEKGWTPLHLAAQYYHRNCLKMLIKHGGDLTVVNSEDDSVIDIIFREIIKPERIIKELLDEQILMKRTDKYKHYYTIDFTVLAPKKCRRQMEVISNVLVVASEDEKTEVLQHPVIELYLLLKWSRISYFFYLWISIYAVFAVFMGFYATLILHNYHVLHVMKTTVKYILILTSSGLLGHAILQCVLMNRNYLRRYELWMNLICTCLSLTVVIIADHTVDDSNGNAQHSNFSGAPTWLLHATSIAVLLAWIELMLLIGRLPSLGYYALMFSTVLQNVVKVLLAFLCLVIGFALSFSIQFRSYEQFSDPWRALVKTTVMMMGEFEYADLFADSRGGSLLPRIIFLMFIILTSIVLMNLMVGLAVSDIQELQRRGRARKLEKRAEFLCQLEKVISSRQLNSKYIPTLIKRVFVRRSFVDDKYELETSAEFHRTHRVPRRLMDSITAIAKGRKQLQEEN
ncbi:transient receptor potential channel pyrexia-like [Anoplophora glabripennis]|uniref:transient receptor potential channel pyrexia-like n=1 Tax=Anoplophora glabripennis TaxID=217634 RepID=UPI0008735A67|nr:transient receptor potential channel pyrexia-like [Anoplophora glabripennis]